MTPRSITILGATGSIGKSAAQVIAAHRERFQVVAVTAGRDVAALARVARELQARHAVIADPEALGALQSELTGSSITAAAGPSALRDAAARPADIVVSAIVGAAGVAPTAAAVRAGNTIALANKECLVCAGGAFLDLAKRHNVHLLPVDSEHNGLFQLLDGRNLDDIAQLIITASGGPFLNWPAERLAVATPADALAHPTWVMGPKITVDSATLMNKGLELIEAHYLFSVAQENLSVLVHPQSVVHALVAYKDGSLHAEIGAPDMRRPIAHCLFWPARSNEAVVPLELAEIAELQFMKPDGDRFPALGLAQQALSNGNGAPTVLNAANEIAVEAFLRQRIAFSAIAEIVTQSLDDASRSGIMKEPATIEAALELDGEARRIAEYAVRGPHRAAG